MFSKIFDNQATLITPNQRLALYLQQQYNLMQMQAGKKSWPTKTILPLNAWLKILYHNNNPTKILLNPHQERIIWENIIKPFADVKIVQTAWRLAKQFELDLNKYATTLEDEEVFLTWSKKMSETLTTNNWLDQASIINELLLLNTIDHGTSHLILVGFEQSAIYPQLKKLLTLFTNQDVKIEYQHLVWHASAGGNPTPKTLAADNTEQEITSMAHWAKQIAAANPEATIGCVVPELNNLRTRVEVIFNKIIPEQFDISLGKPLKTLPIIHDAIQILNLAFGQINSEQLNLLLHSPFIKGATIEYLARSALNAKLQTTIIDTIKIEDLLGLVKNKEQPYYTPILAELFDKYLLLTNSKNGTKIIAEWINCFAALLTALGWPGERELTSDEYQQLERWQKMLAEEFITIGLLHPKLTFAQALKYLTTIAAEIIFQTNKPSTPIKILGSLEAAGLTFDYLWVMGLTDESWPPAPAPNPFLSVKLQKQLNMPHSSAERELQFCRELTARFAISAQEVIFSYSITEQDRSLRPSSLIKNYPSSRDLIAGSKGRENLAPLETITDEIAPPLTAQAAIAGGSKIFKLQAACPFRAFAECRLGALPSETSQLGLNAKERGILVHSMLATAWNKIGTHQQLCVYSESELKQIIAESVSQSLIALNKPAVKRQQFLAIETKRLVKILYDWLTLEKQRLPFKVLQHEQQTKVKLADLPEITLRIDRVDQMADGSLIIFDYKTGRVSKTSWQTERPDEPQLPLYSVTAPQPINGIAYAQIKNGELKFEGIAQTEHTPGIEVDANWSILQNSWREILSKLGKEFAQGYAQVDPKDSAKTCRLCHLSALCRVNEKF